MPSWSLGEIGSAITARIGHRSDLAASTVSFYVNQAYLEVALLDRHPELERIAVSSTTSGENRIDLPSDMLEMITLSYLTTQGWGSSRTLKRLNETQVDGAGFHPIGKSDSYVLYANWLELWPSPNSAYSMQLRYLSRPSDMTAADIVPSVATEWRPAIMYLGEALLHEYVGNAAEGAAARMRYVGYAQTVKNAMAHRQAAGPMAASSLVWRGRRRSSGRFDQDDF